MVPSTLSCSNTWTSAWACCGATSVPDVRVGASVSVPFTNDDDANCVSPSVTGATWAAEDFDVVVVFPDTVGSWATARSRICCSWPPFCKSPITFTTSANLIGLACAGTATNSSKPVNVAIGRKTRVLIWLGTPSSRLQTAIFNSSLMCRKPDSRDTALTACRGYKPANPQGLVLSVRETELMRGGFQFQKRI